MKCDYSAIFSVLGIVSSAIVSVWVVKLRFKYLEKSNLYSELKDILQIAIENPFLERQKFLDSWIPESDFVGDYPEDFEKYEIYMDLVYNYLFRVSKYFKFNQEKVQEFIKIKEWVKPHKRYWLKEVKVLSKYSKLNKDYESFIKIINKILE